MGGQVEKDQVEKDQVEKDQVEKDQVEKDNSCAACGCGDLTAVSVVTLEQVSLYDSLLRGVAAGRSNVHRERHDSPKYPRNVKLAILI